MKSMGRNNGDAQTWLTAWAKTKGIEENDRVMHEMRTLINILFYAATLRSAQLPRFAELRVGQPQNLYYHRGLSKPEQGGLVPVKALRFAQAT